MPSALITQEQVGGPLGSHAPTTSPRMGRQGGKGYPCGQG